MGRLGKFRAATDALQRSLELYRYGQVEDELKQMRLQLFSRQLASGEIQSALADQVDHQRSTHARPRPLMLQIQFDFDTATLTPEGSDQIDKLSEALAVSSFGAGTLEIIGDTDLLGPADYNQRLSERRAETVGEEIVRRHGLPRNRIRTKGRGMREPLYPGAGAEESSLNRRVEVTFLISGTAGAP